MTRLREEFDADVAAAGEPVGFRSADAQHALICETCGGTFYADDLQYAEYGRAAEHGIQKPFICTECLEAANEIPSN